ncbi:MAG TPA: hypothetical protein VMW30_03490 [Candidatus Paceibacterota bacterium]|nr:hypothetical protein [Candidatus Paceibacterota bacterium]
MTNGIYVTDDTRPLQQGDIVLGSGVVRLTALQDIFIPPAWAGIDTIQSQLSTSKSGDSGLGAIGGSSLVMVLSHDCQLDKELNRSARNLMKSDPSLTSEEAFEIAEKNPELDRFVLVAPLVDVDQIPNGGDQNFTNNVLRGAMLGYFPLQDETNLAISRTVVDLSYRSTVDILTLTQRLTSLSDIARMQLRYALARMDSLRVPVLDASFSEAIGQKITDIQSPRKASPTVRLILENGKALEVLLPATSTDQEGPTRKKTRVAKSK